jgi:menaquinone-9 beta-reductase
MSYDALVIGARAAGAATAMLLARRGARVLAVERGARGADTLSTHALMRAGVLQLARWGLLERIEAAGTPRIAQSVVHYEDEVVPIPIKPKYGVPALYAPRRTILDRVLADAAVEAGAEVRYGRRASELVRSPRGRVTGVVLTDADGHCETVSAAVVIGADGLRSTLAGRVEAPATRLGRHSTATVYGYWSRLEVDGYHWYWRTGAAAGAIPTNDGQVLVFVTVPPWRFWQEFRADVPAAYHRWLEAAAPDLARPLARARLASGLHGFAGHAGYLRRPWGAGWALVGDSGYFNDPISAHGLSDALRDAELLADAVVRGGEQALADYETRRNALSSELFDATEAIASFEWDNAGLKALHRRLSDAMKREVQALVALFEERREVVCR